ncbi:hypothetical protein POWCR01_000242900 (apicoplast) [Plasmodium ovale]|uniref:Uncharacterized protein n=1 Tax=Plasmodium ovale TaxID=36330 RepID=A0A2D0NLA4_PLAOA|nr:hypothetical protein POWCR01_000242900 [Plasmodium ovale]
MKINIIKYYNKYNKKTLKNNNFILNNKYIIIKLNFYEYIKNKLQIYNFKGILINYYNKYNYIIILKYNNYNTIFLFLYLNSLNLINIYKIGKFSLTKI